MRRSISNKCKRLLRIDTSPALPVERSFRCAEHEKYRPNIDASPQSSPVTPATSVELDKEKEEGDDDEGEEEGEKNNDKNRWRYGTATEPPKPPNCLSPIEALTQDWPVEYEEEWWEAFSDLRPPPPPAPAPPSAAPSPLQRPGNTPSWTPSPSTFDTTSAAPVLSTLDGCSIPVSGRYLPLYADVLCSAGTSTCRCGGDAYTAAAALLRAWPDFARRVWGLVRSRAARERDAAVAAWRGPAQDALRELLGDSGDIDRAVSDAVQEALRRKARELTGVGEATVVQWAREDVETIDWLEGWRSPERPLGFIRNAFANMNF